MPRNRQVLHARAPELIEVRGERRLLVWGALAQWMVVDDELFSFLKLFDGKATFKQILRKHARRSPKSRSEAESEAREIAEQLLQRGILGESVEPPAIAPEEVRIANVTLNITNRCNLRCKWCYNADHKTAEAPVEQLLDGIAGGRELFSPDASLIILGGEPLLDLPRLLAALDRAKGLFRPAPLVSTNGTLLTEQAVSELAARGSDVQVSLDSHQARKHDALRGAGTFAKVCAGVKRLVAAGVHTTLSMTLSRETVADMEGFLALATELGASEARFIPMRMIGRGKDHAELAPDFAEAFERLLEILERRPGLRALLERDFFSILMTVCRFSATRTNCGIGRKVIFIDADGKVYPCPNHLRPEYLCGDLTRQSLAEIIAESPILNSIRKRYHVERYTQCQTCPFRHWCAGDCRGEALAVTGDSTQPSPHCAELRSMLQRMLWLIADGDERLGARQKLRSGRAVVDQFLD